MAIAFYNCENLFDTLDDPATHDDDFTPSGKYRYHSRIYRAKLHNIATVLRSINDAQGPVLVGLAEIENDAVLAALSQQPELSALGYQYVCTHGSDQRGINVGLLYRAADFAVIRHEAISIDLTGTGGKSNTRDVLHITGLLLQDTVDLLVNHWPSRAGGEQQSAPKRAAVARVNRELTDHILHDRPGARIIIMGDMNDNPDDVSIARVLNAAATREGLPANGLYNPFATLYSSGQGTEVYHHHWNLFDQLILSRSWLHTTGLHYLSAGICKPAFITDKYKGHEGEPHRSFRGTYWINGYSDHFPVVVYVSR